MIIAYLPKEKDVIMADMSGPPSAGGPPFVSPMRFALPHINRLSLMWATHVPIHATPDRNRPFERIWNPEAARAPQVVAAV